jgi:hypothetical protein
MSGKLILMITYLTKIITAVSQERAELCILFADFGLKMKLCDGKLPFTNLNFLLHPLLLMSYLKLPIP